MTIINKFSDTGRHKVNLVAFVKNLQSLVAFVTRYSRRENRNKHEMRREGKEKLRLD